LEKAARLAQHISLPEAVVRPGRGWSAAWQRRASSPCCQAAPAGPAPALERERFRRTWGVRKGEVLWLSLTDKSINN